MDFTKIVDKKAFKKAVSEQHKRTFNSPTDMRKVSFINTCKFISNTFGEGFNKLTLEEHIEFQNQPCKYCGDDALGYRVVARLKRTMPYCKTNCVAICKLCIGILGALPEEKLEQTAKICEYMQTNY